ncbi:GlsB/YeaQ/YmgE family stress response membrane protein [Paenibacillus sp. YN15]|uniref:GlsB/YeaQ/YmgE family stress response membrane protein n=1 Tax=Paenibacillus sp. YN15 TaxID=1742774 RepID=UPI000DCDF28C|nr:GlsB/YeaQ/YmgE family stress response membrane protein [Paenibacillus sp. YN15]RAU94929.1 GlsB/YeaQ/YmgE family stress response membrane protein [Paenibacillus sp. YN15]
MGFIWALIIGGVIGWLAGVILGRDIPGGVIGNIIAGFIGAWLGSLIMGDFGPVIGGFYFIPALIGAVVVVFLTSLILRNTSRRHS